MTVGRAVRKVRLYVAPEVLAGTPATARSDLYSLGVLLWFLATGAFPVEGKTIGEIFARHADGATAGSLRALRPGLPRKLATAIESCLNPDPARRPQSALLVRSALERVAGPNGRRATT